MRVLHFINLLLICGLSLAPSYPDAKAKKERSTYDQIKTLKPQINERLAREISKAVDSTFDKNLRGLVVALIFVESSFNPKAMSVTGDRGLTQISPELARIRRIREEKLHNISYSLQRTRVLFVKLNRWTDWHSKTPSKAKAYKTKVKAAYYKAQKG